MRVAVKEVGKPLQIIETTKKYRGDCAKSFIGQKKTIEYVPVNQDSTLELAVDEMGLPLNLPTNFLFLSNNPVFPVQKIVGTVVFIRCKYANPWKEIWDYEVEDLTDKDLELIEKILEIGSDKRIEKYLRY